MRFDKVSFLLLIALLFFSNNGHAEIKKNITLKYSESAVAVDYSGAPWKTEFSGIQLMRCTEASSEKCVPILDMKKTDAESFEVSGYGLYYIKFINPDYEFLGAMIPSATVYSQFIAIMERPDTNIIDVAQKHSPLFSFHALENYFPVSVDKIFDRPYSDLEYATFQDGYRGVTSTDNIKSLLIANGSSENKISLKHAVARTLPGSKDDFPVYWYMQRDGSDVWITYFVMYAFDEKYNDYLVGESLASIGNHSIDRESISVKFSMVNGTYKPSDVVYAGHLESQKTNFLGCKLRLEQPLNCAEPGALPVTWEGGKTSVEWENVSRIGDRPIVYVAHGSHASTPAVGWYYIDVSRIDFADVREPAGNSVSDNLKGGNLSLIDLSNEYFAPLTYSGYLINAPADWYRVFPFVRFPILNWAANSNRSFSDCLGIDASYCRIHQNIPTVPIQAEPSFSINFDQDTLTALGATGSNYTLITGKDGRPAVQFAGVSNPGYMRFPNHTSMWFSTGGTFDFWARVDSNTGMNGYGSTSTQGWAMALLAKSHDRTGVVINTVAADPNYPGDGYGFSGFSTFDNTWGSSNPPCVIHQRNPGNQLGTWFRVTAVASNTSGTQIYINKQLVSECAGARPEFVTMNSQDLYIGRYSSSWYPLHGAIQDIRLYNKALTASEVNALQ